MAIEGGVLVSLAFIGSTLFFFLIGICFFNFGLKYYKFKSYININE